MRLLRYTLFGFVKFLLLWILIFDFQRILFLIHQWDKFYETTLSDIFLAFFHSFRLDLSTAAGLSVLPMLFFIMYFFIQSKWIRYGLIVLLLLEFLLVGMIHAGEVNAYTEWNHKLTSRVFMHLSNPDEVVRSADYSMTVWFFIFLFIEMVFSWKMFRYLFKKQLFIQSFPAQIRGLFVFPLYLLTITIISLVSLILLRGGIQTIPININSAIFSNSAVANDLSINPLYFFSKSYMLYNRSEIDEFMPKINREVSKKIVENLYRYERKHDQYFLANKRPNIVFVVLESWSADAISCLSERKGTTPHFDQIAAEGVLFTNLYCTSHTSEIGNASIFSGFPGIPEVSISMQPEKSRKLTSLNQSLKPLGYTSSYVFSGDLKYGNIGGFFMDHGFDVVKDENDFPGGIPRGKLNYYDADLYDFFLKEINQAKEPFMQCAFTGSTHSPFDVPKTKGQNHTGQQADFMNSLVYADQCLGEFVKNVKKMPWFKNTLFVFVADHSHTTPSIGTPLEAAYYRIPLLFWGPVIKNEFKGKRIDRIGSQIDIPATILYQMGQDASAYIWSRDLMNPHSTSFAFHTIIRGYGWRTDNGYLTYQMQMKNYLEEEIDTKLKEFERQRCQAFLTEIYHYYKAL